MSNKVNKIYALIGAVSCIFLIIFSQECMGAALTGFDMWLCFVMPSVFPFFVCMYFMKESGILSVNRNAPVIPLFLSCALCGAPSGAALCAHLYGDDERLSQYVAVCNMASPTFITGTLVAMTGMKAIVLPVAIGSYGASFLLLCFLKMRGKKVNANIIPSASNIKREKRKFFDLLCNAMSEGTKMCVGVCGVIIFFTVFLAAIVKLLNVLGVNNFSPAMLFTLSLVELTNGTGMVFAAAESIGGSVGFSFPILCAMMSAVLSFGGICIMAQAAQLAQIKPWKYIKTKLLCAGLSAMIAFIAAQFFPCETPVLSNMGEVLGTVAEGSVSLAVMALSGAIGCSSIWLTVKSMKKS